MPALNYFQNKGFSGQISADFINTAAIAVGLGTVFEIDERGSYLGWWAGIVSVSILTSLTAAFLKKRFKEDGGTGTDVLSWVTLLVAVCTLLAGFLSLIARAVNAENLQLPEWLTIVLPVLILLLLVGIPAFYITSIRRLTSKKSAKWSILFFIFFALLMGILVGLVVGFADEVKVPFDDDWKRASWFIAILGLIFWQDAELVNVFSNDNKLQRWKSILQCLGALVLLGSAVFITASGPPVAVFWVGVGIAGLGTLLGMVAGARNLWQKRHRDREVTPALEQEQPI